MTNIFVIYHQPGKALDNEVLKSIAVGGKKDQFSKEFFRDDKGENIAEKNSFFNEMTAIYWVYKHINEFKNVDHFGFAHYRRLFCFKGNKKAYVKKDICEDLINVSTEEVNEIFKNHDFIIPRPSHYKSVQDHFEKSHNKEDLVKLIDVIDRVAPEYYEAAAEYFNQRNEYLYNMFVFSKEDFVKYGDFIFKVLDEFTKDFDKSKRLYVSERLTGIFVYSLIKSGKKPAILPILHVRSKSLKVARKQVKQNFKEKADRGFIYKIKPLILCLLPRHLEQWYRRRKAR